ncbi:hypothetical protein N7539_001812 [Penicillium diatomitis]|uniref:Uncharacterized protein n=1 Tax=Penicillium diatomitis TaxID=2819901 RepID=A0A9W9XHH2_9EURO|nr:uncharacterized protein N7539_001812 [Penicillium diatomitis]KAJ5493066.1 hypothetical protein N7539_001812 [Penicillium diatomitis]
MHSQEQIAIFPFALPDPVQHANPWAALARPQIIGNVESSSFSQWAICRPNSDVSTRVLYSSWNLGLKSTNVLAVRREENHAPTDTKASSSAPWPGIFFFLIFIHLFPAAVCTCICTPALLVLFGYDVIIHGFAVS